MKKTAAKAPQQRRLVIKGAASAEAALAQEEAAVAKQNQWARNVADGIERGELPSATIEREMVALILRSWADRVRPAKPKKRGNPSFTAKVYDPDRVALEVALLIGFGDEADDAVGDIAVRLGVDESTVWKIFRPRRVAAAQWFVNSNLAHRVGAIRGE